MALPAQRPTQCCRKYMDRRVWATHTRERVFQMFWRWWNNVSILTNVLRDIQPAEVRKTLQICKSSYRLPFVMRGCESSYGSYQYITIEDLDMRHMTVRCLQKQLSAGPNAPKNRLDNIFLTIPRTKKYLRVLRKLLSSYSQAFKKTWCSLSAQFFFCHVESDYHTQRSFLPITAESSQTELESQNLMRIHGVFF